MKKSENSSSNADKYINTNLENIKRDLELLHERIDILNNTLENLDKNDVMEEEYVYTPIVDYVLEDNIEEPIKKRGIIAYIRNFMIVFFVFSLILGCGLYYFDVLSYEMISSMMITIF